MPLGTIEEREIWNLIFTCLFGLTHIRIHFKGLIWQSGFQGNKMSKQKPLVMIAIPGFYNFPYKIVVDAGEKEIYLTITKMFLVLKKKKLLEIE